MSMKIIDAVRNSQYSQLMLFMRHNYNFRVKTLPECYNVLMISLQIPDAKKRFKMFSFLLKHELVNLTDTDLHGHDIFFTCVIRECERELEHLMKHFHTELDWTRMDNYGKTILHYAVINNNLKILETLLSYCLKYKINVDIPDRLNKITPYLLACRLNYTGAADLLANVGNASKNQADQTVFYDAERWKKEGQIELVKNYLRSKEEEKNFAKLQGNIRVYKELCALSNNLDEEVDKNPEILPVIAKVIIDHDSKERGSSCNIVVRNNNTNSQIPQLKFLNDGPERLDRSNTIFIHKNRLKNNKSSISCNSNSSCSPPLTTPSSSAFSNYMKQTNGFSTHLSLSNSILPANINIILKEKIKDISEKKSSPTPAVNSLLELTNGQSSVDHFVSSKSDAELQQHEEVSKPPSSTRLSSRQQASSSSFNPISPLHSLFLAASLQKTNNYRSTVKYVPDQPIFFKREPVVKHKIPKAKSTLSSFKLITIQEESRLYSSKASHMKKVARV